jgi:hypothetical protein
MKHEKRGKNPRFSDHPKYPLQKNLAQTPRTTPVDFQLLHQLLLNLKYYFSQNEEPPVHRICYSSMKHTEGDVIRPRDCIIVASGHRKKDLPFIAKVTAIWEDPDDGKYYSNTI